jgi:hypothetical protein
MTETIPFLSFAQLTVSGPSPFSSNSGANRDSVGASTITIKPDAVIGDILLNDQNGLLEDSDSKQTLAQPVTINGTSYGVGDNVEIEYSYVLRPVGSTDPADYVTIYVLEFEGEVEGITADGFLESGVTYQIISLNDDPVVAYSNIALCLDARTPVLTERGYLPIGDVPLGLRIQTADNGMQPVVWLLRDRVFGLGRMAPVQIAAGRLGNDQPLVLSPQHRVLWRGGLLPAKGLLGLPGVVRSPRPVADYVHLLCPRHEVIFAAGVCVESFLPGAQALRSLGTGARSGLSRALAACGRPHTDWDAARPLLRVGQVRRRPDAFAPRMRCNSAV